MFEDGLKERKGRVSKGGLEQTSFDKEMEERKDSSTTLIHQPILRKESTGRCVCMCVCVCVKRWAGKLVTVQDAYLYGDHSPLPATAA